MKEKLIFFPQKLVDDGLYLVDDPTQSECNSSHRLAFEKVYVYHRLDIQVVGDLHVALYYHVQSFIPEYLLQNLFCPFVLRSTLVFENRQSIVSV